MSKCLVVQERATQRMHVPMLAGMTKILATELSCAAVGSERPPTL